MKGWLILAAAALCLLAAGCADTGPSMTKEEAEDTIFTKTDVANMTPEMKAKIPANGLGPVGGAPGGSQPMGPGAAPPPDIAAGQAAPK